MQETVCRENLTPQNSPASVVKPEALPKPLPPEGMGVSVGGPLKRFGRKPMPITKQSIIERCLFRTDTGCWIWKFHTNRAGYPYGTEFRKNVAIHRRAYELWHGPIPKGLYVCHRCDTPPCCNPDHLFAGTNSENMTDAFNKGRVHAGTRAPLAKLNADQVRRIRVDSRSQRVIAEEFGVNQVTISRVKLGVSYLDVL